ncbi:MAG: hypothetical protein AAFQ79_17725 [Pseudomonadota bacterium]
MWHSHFNEGRDHISFLVHAGDKNTTGTSFVDFDNLAIRDIEKNESEGAHNSAHVVILKNRQPDERYRMAFEKVPGVSMSSLQDHFRWTSNCDDYSSNYENAAGHEASATAHYDVIGVGSRTLGEAIARGTFQDVEFVKMFETPAALDEGIEVHPIESQRWDIRRQTSLETAGRIIENLGRRFREFADGEESEMFVRVKSNSGQIKRTEIVDLENPLEQVFVENRFLSDFAEPLPSRYEEPNDEVLAKLLDYVREPNA